MKIAIIGCGYVGMAIARRWSQEGHTVTATTTTPSRLSELEEVAKRGVVIKGNDLDALLEILPGQEVVLLSMGDRSRTKFKETYLETAKTLVDILKQAPTVKQVIYTSSYSIYGNQQGNWADENSEVMPGNDNDKILYETEQALLAAITPLRRVCVFRLGGIYGPGRSLEKIFSPLAGITRPGAGGYFTNWIHLDDIVGALEFARAKELQGVYNLVSDVPVIGRELVTAVCDRYNLTPVSWDPSAPETRTLNVRVSNQKLKDAGFEFIRPQVLPLL